MFPSEGVELQMGLSSVGDLLKSHTIQFAVRTFRAFFWSSLIMITSRVESITAYRFEDVDVLVSGDQVGAFGDACSRLELVPRQHPDLSRNKHESGLKMLF